MVVFAWILLAFSVLLVVYAAYQAEKNPSEVGNKLMIVVFFPFVVFFTAFLIMGYGT